MKRAKRTGAANQVSVWQLREDILGPQQPGLQFHTHARHDAPVPLARSVDAPLGAVIPLQPRRAASVAASPPAACGAVVFPMRFGNAEYPTTVVVVRAGWPAPLTAMPSEMPAA